MVIKAHAWTTEQPSSIQKPKMASGEIDTSLVQNELNDSIENDTDSKVRESNDCMAPSAEACTKSIDDEQPTHEFKNIDIKIQGGDVQILLSENEADDISCPRRCFDAPDTSTMLSPGIGTQAEVSRKSRTQKPRKWSISTDGR